MTGRILLIAGLLVASEAMDLRPRHGAQSPTPGASEKNQEEVETASEVLTLPGTEFFHGTELDRVYMDLATLPKDQIPSSLAHSGGFGLMLFFWTALTLVAPMALYFSSSDRTGAMCTLFFGGLLYLLWHIRLVLQVLVKPPPPAPCQVPFTKPPKIQKFQHALLVYNPHAGKEKAEETVRKMIVPMLESKDMKVTLAPTTCAGHAREIVAEDLGDVDVVIPVGGDGTVHEVVNALIVKNNHNIDKSNETMKSSSSSAFVPSSLLL